MADLQGSPKRILIPKGTLEANENNIIEIPEACDESRILIAKLQKKLYRPPRYYPPLTNPENKFARHIGDVCVGLGMPPLSPLKEERGNYKSSFSQYGPPKKPAYESYEPSYFDEDTRHGSREFSGKFDYCPTSTPLPCRSTPATEFPSPNLSPVRLGRDLFAPDPSVYRSGFTPDLSPPRRPRGKAPRRPSPGPSPGSPCSVPVNMSGVVPFSRSPSPQMRRSPPRRPAPPPQPRQQASPYSDGSCSIDDLSGMMSSGGGGGSRPTRAPAPQRPRPPPLRRQLFSPPQPRAPTPRQPSPYSDGSCSIDDISGMMSGSGSPARSPRRAPSPQRAAPPSRQPDPCSEGSCSIGDLSDMMSSGSRGRASPPRPSPPRRSPPRAVQRAPAPRQQSPSSDQSLSIGDVSGMMSFGDSRQSRRSPCASRSSRRASPQRSSPRQQRAPSPRRSPSPRGSPCSESLSSGDVSNMMSSFGSSGRSPIPEELHNRVMSDSMQELDFIELDELRTIHQCMRVFQDARRELVLSILALPEAEIPSID